MALITQTAAQRLLKQQTGLSVRQCKERVASMPKYPDGARLKVFVHSVDELVRELSRPPERSPAPVGVRPISATHAERLQGRP